MPELAVLVPEAFVPCQYQVTPVGGLPRVIVFAPHEFVDTVGVAGVAGGVDTVTEKAEEALLQHKDVLFRARIYSVLLEVTVWVLPGFETLVPEGAVCQNQVTPDGTVPI